MVCMLLVGSSRSKIRSIERSYRGRILRIRCIVVLLGFCYVRLRVLVFAPFR